MILGELAKNNSDEACFKLETILAKESSILAELEKSSEKDIKEIDLMTQAIISRVLSLSESLKQQASMRLSNYKGQSSEIQAFLLAEKDKVEVLKEAFNRQKGD